MESQGEEREDERLVSQGGVGVGGGGGDGVFWSYCFLIAEFAGFIINRVVLFYLIFQYQHPDSSIISYLIYTTNNLMEAVYLSEIVAGDEPILTHPIHAFAGRFVFWIERLTHLFASVYFQSGKHWIIPAVLFCFTNTVFIIKFMQWIYKWMNSGEPFIKVGMVENNLQEGKVEPNQDPLRAEIPEEENLPEEKVGFDLEGEIVEEEKTPKEKVELDQEVLEGEMVKEDKLPKEKAESQEPLGGEIVVVAQGPEEDKLPKEEVELDGEALKLITLGHELQKLEWVNHSDPHDFEELRWLAVAIRDHDELVKEPKEEPVKTDREEKSPPLKEANGKWNEDDEDSNEDEYSTDDSDEKENRLKEYKEQCLALEEEKKVLAAKLAAAVESLEHYLQNEKDYLDDRNNWVIEKKNLSLKLEDARAAYSQEKDDASQASLSSTQMQQRLLSELAEMSSLYQCYQAQCLELLEERNRLSSQLNFADSSAEFYKACLDDSKYECRKLREEKDELTARLIAETSYSEYYHELIQKMVEKKENVVEEMEKKNRKLEEEKIDVVAKLRAAKVLAELYRSYLHNCGI